MPGAGGGPVVVTGAAGGIGLAYARAFAAQGRPVAVFDRAERVLDVASEGMLGVVADVADEDSVDAAFTRVEREFGAPTVLVNNAALFAELPFTGWRDIDVTTWDRVLAVNLRGPFLCARRPCPG